VTHSSGTAVLEQDVSAVAAEKYYVTFEIKNRTAGTVTPSVGGVAGTAASDVGLNTQIITATGTGNLQFTPTTDFDGSIDSVSVKKIDSGGNIYAMGSVGIGTMNPAALLEISGATPEMRLTDSDSGEYGRLTKSNTLNQLTLYNKTVSGASAAGIDSYTMLNMHADNDESEPFYDSSSSHRSPTITEATVSSTRSRFGGYSGYFPGSTTSKVTYPSSADFDFGTGDFTIDAWIWADTSFSATKVFVAKSSTSGYGWILFHQSNKICFAHQAGGDWGAFTYSDASLVDGQFNHVAVTVQSGVLKYWINGVQRGGYTPVSAINGTAGNTLDVGFWQFSNTYNYAGYIDELRISKGIARWTEAFTPPTIAYIGAGATVEVPIIKSVNGSSGYGSDVTFSGIDNKTIIEGKTLSFNVVGVEKMRLDSAGNFGIGTTAPLLKMDVAGSTRLAGTATSVLTGSIDPAASTTVTGVGTLFATELVVGDRITVSAETRTVTAIASDTSLTVDTAFTDNADDASPDKLAAIFIARDSTGAVKMVVSDSGNIGIGTSAPAALFHLSSVTPELRLTDTTNSEYASLTKSDTTNKVQLTNRTTSGQGGIDGFTSLELHMDAGFSDSSLSPKTATLSINPPTIGSTAPIKFSNYGLFNGVNNTAAYHDDADWSIASRLATWEWWEYRTDTDVIAAVMSRQLNGNTQPSFIMGGYNVGNVVFYAYQDSVWDIAMSVSCGVAQLNTWTHYAVVQNGDYWYTFQNGVQISHFTSTKTVITQSSATYGDLAVGAYKSGATLYPFGGKLDEVRFDIGVARYIGSSTTDGGTYFTPQTVPYAASGVVENSVIESVDGSTGYVSDVKLSDTANKTIIEGLTTTFNIAGTEKMRLDSAGNLGIGTASPLLKLDVAGSVRFTGTATSVLTGSIDPTASTTVTGVGTLFTTELVVGDRITVSTVTKTVTAIASNTSLTVDTAFTDLANDTTPDKLAAIFVARDSSSAVKMIINDSGNVGIGVTSPLASLHLKAGTTDPATAPLKFSSGTNMTAAEAGAMEYDGTALYFTPGSVRRTIPMISSGSGVPATTPTFLGEMYIDSDAKDIYIAGGTASSADWKKVN
jgi:hypothetical protein